MARGRRTLGALLVLQAVGCGARTIGDFAAQSDAGDVTPSDGAVPSDDRVAPPIDCQHDLPFRVRDIRASGSLGDVAMGALWRSYEASGSGGFDWLNVELLAAGGVAVTSGVLARGATPEFRSGPMLLITPRSPPFDGVGSGAPLARTSGARRKSPGSSRTSANSAAVRERRLRES